MNDLIFETVPDMLGAVIATPQNVVLSECEQDVRRITRDMQKVVQLGNTLSHRSAVPALADAAVGAGALQQASMGS
jgi:hypothetical protein